MEEVQQSSEQLGFGIRSRVQSLLLPITTLRFGTSEPSSIFPTCQMGTIILTLYIHSEE